MIGGIMRNINIRLLIVAVLISITFVVFLVTIPKAIWLVAWAIVTPPKTVAIPLAAVLATAALTWGLGLAAIMYSLFGGFIRIWKGER